jgi:hypothetical protein
MLKRIEELAKEAKLSWCIQNEFDRENLEKFVELVVRECVMIATYPHLGDEESYYGDKFAKAIKKHFGVTE